MLKLDRIGRQGRTGSLTCLTGDHETLDAEAEEEGGTSYTTLFRSIATQVCISAVSPAESLVSVASHIQPNQPSRQLQGGGPRNGAFPPANGGKRSRVVTVPSGPTDQYEMPRGAREMYTNQPPNSSSMHPSLPLPYPNGHHPGVDWTMNNNQLEGPGMPVARGSSHPVSVQNLSIATTSTPVDQQADSTTGGGDEGEVEDERKYCFCDRVSYGEMIGCDEPNCEREWVRSLPNFLRTPLVLTDMIVRLVSFTVPGSYNSSPGYLVL